MNLLAPAALALSVVAAPIVAMYMLKMRRPERVVPSAFLWQSLVQDAQANAPWQRLRHNLLLLLQLLAAAALVLALARPYILRAALTRGDVVVVLDTSVLMRATDVRPSRFARARERIGMLIDGLGPAEMMSIVLMARRPRVLIAQNGDHGALHAALDRVTPTFETPDTAAALSVAAALAHGDRRAAIYVFVAAGDPPVSAPAGLAARVHRVTLGGVWRDLGVIDFAAARADDGSVTALARVMNLGRRDASGALQIDVATGVPGHLQWHAQVDLHPVALAPGTSVVVARARLRPDTAVLKARLVGGDDLAADDTAWAVVPTTAPRRVLLVAPRDALPFASLALSLIPAVQLQTVAPYTYALAHARCADAVVFEGGRLPAALPPGPVLSIAPAPGPSSPLGLAVGRTRPAIGLDVADDPDGLLRNTDVMRVGVSQITPLQAPPWAATVLRARGVSTGAPVLIAGENGGRREAVLGLDLADTNWGLSPGFPILLQNLLNWLAPPRGTLAGVYRPSDPVALPVAPCARALSVVEPSGRRVRVAIRPGLTYDATALPGVYRVEDRLPTGVRSDLFAVNLFPVLAAPAPGATVYVSPSLRVGTTMSPVEVAPLVAALALGILSCEWWVAARSR